MKNSDIHNDLPQKEIRNFLATSLCLAFEQERDNKKQVVTPYTPTTEWFVADAKADLAFYQRKLEIVEHKHAIISMIKQSGWQEFDVSDETEIGKYAVHMCFIGTKEEYNELAKNFT